MRHYYLIGSDGGGLALLMGQQPVTWDAGDAVRGTHAGFVFATSEMVLTGSAFGDRLEGGTGNDTILGGDGDDMIQPGGNAGGDLIDTGAGSDTVDFYPGVFRTSHYTLSHRSLGDQTGIVATLFDNSFTPSVIDKGSFGQTRLVSMSHVFPGGGVTVEGTGLDDRFDITFARDGTFGYEGFFGLVPGQGNDTVRAEGFGRLGLNFATDSNGNAATEGAQVNLATGTVANDGFGFADVLVFSGRIDVSVTLTAEADTLVVTNRSGTLRGGDGIDTLDYGQGAFTEGVQVDLAANIVRGGGPTDGTTLWGNERIRHVISSFENLTGTRDHGDRLAGTDGANVIRGLGGDDTILGDGFRAAYAPTEAVLVYRLYQAAFDRAPDAVGLHSWTERLAEFDLSPNQVAAGFAASAEFHKAYDRLTNQQFVTELYRNALDRDPDAAELAGWVWQLLDGASRAQVLAGIAASPEVVAKTPVDARGFAEAGWSDDVFRLYQATLDRAPDEAGFLDWLGRLGGGTRFLSAVDGFVGSAEFRATYGGLDDAAFVTTLYRNVLDRDPDAGGLADWLGKLGAGTLTRAEVVRGFVLSREFVAATADAVTDFVRNLGGGDTLDGGAGDNRLWGGMLADEFVFDADDMAHHRVMDFEAWDFLTFNAFGYDTANDIRAHMTQAGADVVFQDQGVTVTLANTQLAAIADDSLIFFG